MKRNQAGLWFGFSESFWLRFDVKQIIDSLSILFLLTYISLDSNEKELE